MWELDYKESWVLKNWCFGTAVLEKTLKSPLDCKEIKPVNSKENQPWIFIGKTDAEAPILWPPDVKIWFIRNGPDAGKDWGKEEQGMTQYEMVRWHHWLNGHEFEQILGDGEGQGSLVCCSTLGHQESETAVQLNNKTKPYPSVFVQIYSPVQHNVLFTRNISPLQYSCLENPNGQTRLAGYCPWRGTKVRHNLSTKQQHLQHLERQDFMWQPCWLCPSSVSVISPAPPSGWLPVLWSVTFCSRLTHFMSTLKLSEQTVTCFPERKEVQGSLGDIEGSVPEHQSIVNITIKSAIQNFWLPRLYKSYV